MDWSDDELYAKARQRHTKGISRPVSDCEIIVGQETEIDMYREKIRYLEGKLRMGKEPVLQLGDTVTLKASGNEYMFVLENFEMQFNKVCVDTVLIKGSKIYV